MTALSPRQRNIAQVFQFPVIYDTMTVFDNLAFPLHNRSVAKNEVAARVAQVAEMLGLGDVLNSARAVLPGEPSRRSRSAAGWCAATSRRSCSTSR